MQRCTPEGGKCANTRRLNSGLYLERSRVGDSFIGCNSDCTGSMQKTSWGIEEVRSSCLAWVDLIVVLRN